MKRKWAKVSETYFGEPIGNSQDPDESYDHSKGTITQDGVKIGGKGAQGGGSKPANRGNRSGSASLGSSIPKSPQKLRG